MNGDNLLRAGALLIYFIGAAAVAGPSYTYDDLGRVTTVTYDNGYQVTYHYDAAGNRTQVVVNTPPTANAQSVTAVSGSATAITLTGSDPDGDTLSYTIVTQPGHGSLTGTPPNVTYTSAAGYYGADSFTFTANDGVSTSSPATVSISVNAPPTANAQSVTAPSGTGKAITLTGSDPDGDTLSYTIVTQPGHGSLTGTPPNVTYTSAAGYYGADSFTFTANDGVSTSSPATVSISVNAPPTANAQSVTTPMNTAQAITLTGTDPDGDALTYKIASQPSHGTLSGTPPSVTYTPATGYYGADSFTFVVNDGSTDSSPAAVSIFVNAPPVANNDSMSIWKTCAAGTQTSASQSIDPRTNDSDPDGDTLTVIGVTQAAYGVTSYDATHVNYGITTYCSNKTVSDSFDYTISDGHGGTATATVSVSVHINTTQ